MKTLTISDGRTFDVRDDDASYIAARIESKERVTVAITELEPEHPAPKKQRGKPAITIEKE
jgi:hypothetical protein